MEPTSDPVSPRTPVVLKGRCRCGMVECESVTLPLSITICHCISCRRASGALFLPFGQYRNAALKWRSPVTDKDPPIKVMASPSTREASSIGVRGSCGNCGTPLFMKYHCDPDETSVVMGIVDDEHVVGEMPRPTEHIFLKEKARWWSVPDGDGLARYEGFTEAYQARLKDWVSRGSPRRADV